MSLESHIALLQERIASIERLIRACQNSTGWDDAIKDAIIRRDRLLEEHKAMKAEHEAAKTAEQEAKKAAHKAMKAEHEAATTAEHEAKETATLAEQKPQKQQQRCTPLLAEHQRSGVAQSPLHAPSFAEFGEGGETAAVAAAT
jgi:hypothetical protein